MDQEIEITREFKIELSNLHKLHCLAKDFNHMIEYQTESWKMFEPSKFIYSYFTFNTLYNLDWCKSMMTKELTDTPKYHPRLLDEKNKPKKFNESDKYKLMVDFIYDHIEPNQICSVLTSQLLERSSGIEEQDEEDTKEDILDALEDILPSSRITESM